MKPPIAYYNEIDPYAAQWLRNLIAAGHIAPGVVDERSIEDVTPDELRGYTQCHFFAGIGVWSFALRAAGWPDDRPIWTGSCPCQPFSAAGAGAGFADERHLWPTFHHLIAECRPPVVVGEQVASKAIDDWIDLVQTDMEALGYAFGAIAFPSAGIGAPHIRDRTYWVAHATGAGFERRQGRASLGCGSTAEPDSCAGVLCNAGSSGLGERERERGIPGGASGTSKGETAVGASFYAGGMADAYGGHACAEREQRGGEYGQQSQDGSSAGRLANNQLQQRSRGAAGHDVSRGWDEEPTAASGLRRDSRPGPTNGYWSDSDWLRCRDDKWRPVEPGSFPLAHGSAGRLGRVRAGIETNTEAPRKDQGNRVGRLRGYGNAINAEAARVFIECAFPDLEESLV